MLAILDSVRVWASFGNDNDRILGDVDIQIVMYGTKHKICQDIWVAGAGLEVKRVS